MDDIFEMLKENYDGELALTIKDDDLYLYNKGDYNKFECFIGMISTNQMLKIELKIKENEELKLYLTPDTIEALKGIAQFILHLKRSDQGLDVKITRYGCENRAGVFHMRWNAKEAVGILSQFLVTLYYVGQYESNEVKEMTIKGRNVN